MSVKADLGDEISQIKANVGEIVADIEDNHEKIMLLNNTKIDKGLT